MRFKLDENLSWAARDRLSVRGWDVHDVFITSIQDVMRKGVGVNGDAQR